MPALMKMTLTNGHPHQQPVVANTKTIVPNPKKSVNLGLKSSMIARIHNAKPGCGSCGR